MAQYHSKNATNGVAAAKYVQTWSTAFKISILLEAWVLTNQVCSHGATTNGCHRMFDSAIRVMQRSTAISIISTLSIIESCTEFLSKPLTRLCRYGMSVCRFGTVRIKCPISKDRLHGPVSELLPDIMLSRNEREVVSAELRVRRLVTMAEGSCI